MVQLIVINKSHVVPGSNNSRFRFEFQGGGVTLGPKDRIAVSSVTVPYSTFNVSAAYGNNSFSYRYNGTNFAVDMLDGFYDMTDFNAMLQAAFVRNGHYLIDNVGDYWFPGSLAYNPSLYAIQFTALPIPATVPVGYTNPANFSPAATTSIQLVIPDTPVKAIFGFSPGIYPAAPSATLYNVVSDQVPVGSPLNSIVIRCNLAQNQVSNPPDVLFAVSPNVAFGSNIVVQASEYAWSNVRRGNFPALEIQLVDENFNQIACRDPNVCILLLLKLEAEE